MKSIEYLLEKSAQLIEVGIMLFVIFALSPCIELAEVRKGGVLSDGWTVLAIAVMTPFSLGLGWIWITHVRKEGLGKIFDS